MLEDGDVSQAGADDACQLEQAFGFNLSPDEWAIRVGHAFTRDGLAPAVARGPDLPGQHIGPYELIEIIGSGGMGTVWRARRADRHPDRLVALKLIRGGLNSESAHRRFRLEEKVLARLEHPNIARLYDGGTTQGRPFFVMEYVEGLPVTQFAKEHGLSIEARLTLMRHVCDAVQYAHGALVLHRDIKPGNILIATDGTPKLLDFGIAKLLSDDTDGEPGITITDLHVLTPAYASPEQIRGERLSTATDVYSLGVVLFELMTGRLPYLTETGTRHEIERAIIDQEPPCPSQLVSSSKDQALGSPQKRARMLRGDVDAICLKALAKKTSERYQSALELAEDIRRHLNGVPLLAKRPGVLTRFVRSLRRRRGVIVASAIGTCLGLALAAAYVISAFMIPQWQAEHIRSARLALLGHTSTNGLYNVMFYSFDSPDFFDARGRSSPAEAAKAAKAGYAAADKLGDLEPMASGEYAMIRLVGRLGANNPEWQDIWESLPNDTPLTRRYAQHAWEHGTPLPVSDSDYRQADTYDLRTLGLIAFLLKDYWTVAESWTLIPLNMPDPVIECLLGYTHLALDEGELAYPRLLSTHRAYPESGNVTAYLADAAIRCGDIAQAEQYLELAQTRQVSDGGVLVRVRVLVLLAQDRFDEARKILCHPDFDYGPVITVQIAQHLDENGRVEDAILTLARDIYNGDNRRAAFDYFTRLMESWWMHLKEADRVRIADRDWDRLPWTLQTFGDLMVRYELAARRLNALVKPGDKSPHALYERGRWAELYHPLTAQEHRAAREELLSLDVPPSRIPRGRYEFCE